MAYKIDSENLCVLLLKSKSVKLIVFVPLHKLYYEVDILEVLDTCKTKKSSNIDDSYTSKLYKMLGYLRSGTYKGILTYLFNLYHVIGYKTVSTLDKLQSSLALTYAALSHNEDSLAIDIYKYTMYGYPWSKLMAHITDGFSHESRGCLVCPKYRNSLFYCHLKKLLRDFYSPTEDEAGNLVVHKLGKNLNSVILVHPLKIGMLYISNYLNTL